MKTYLELEDQLDLSPSPKLTSSDPSPNTNPQIEKSPKQQRREKDLSPTKELKVVARPNPGNTTVHLPQETAPVNPENQQPLLQKVTAHH